MNTNELQFLAERKQVRVCVQQEIAFGSRFLTNRTLLTVVFV